MSKIIVICGFSGSGKDTIAKYISEHYDYEMVISTTSRPIRKNESEGNPYHFVSKEEFLNLIDQKSLIEYRNYETFLNNIPDTWYYGIERKAIKHNNNYVAVLDLWGLIQIKHYFSDVISFFVDVPDEIRRSRAMLNRSDFDELEWKRRALDDRQKFTQEDVDSCVNFKVSNLEISQCIKDIMREVDLWQENQ